MLRTFMYSAALAGFPVAALALCEGYGPQTPRDISARAGANERLFSVAPPASRMNLCNIHSHTQAEHKGPGFSVSAGAAGWRCNETGDLTEAELAPAPGAYEGVSPGDTIEVHWVFSSCDVSPGPGLGSCLSESCANPDLRVETQVFLVVNDPAALDFADFAHGGEVGGLRQPKALPGGTGAPVTFAGSTTGPGYTEDACSPFHVTWSVRPLCAKLDIGSLHRWAEDNPFEEDHSHGVRQLVTAPELLSRID